MGQRTQSWPRPRETAELAGLPRPVDCGPVLGPQHSRSESWTRKGGEEVAWQEEQSAGCRPASRQYPSLTPGIPTGVHFVPLGGDTGLGSQGGRQGCFQGHSSTLGAHRRTGPPVHRHHWPLGALSGLHRLSGAVYTGGVQSVLVSGPLGSTPL